MGFRLAKEIGRLGIGQTVVVKNQVIVAVEAVEGTDAAIQRGGLLAKSGCVVVKVSKPQQDLRFDVPAVGVETIKRLTKSAARCLPWRPVRRYCWKRMTLLRCRGRHAASPSSVSAARVNAENG